MGTGIVPEHKKVSDYEDRW